MRGRPTWASLHGRVDEKRRHTPSHITVSVLLPLLSRTVTNTHTLIGLQRNFACIDTSVVMLLWNIWLLGWNGRVGNERESNN